MIIEPSSELQLAAIDYAGRSINYTYDRMHYTHRLASRLIRVVVGIIIEKCLEEHFVHKGVDFDKSGRTHWRNRDKAEFIVKNRSIDIKGYHVYPSKGRNFPDWFLDTEVLVPVDQLRRASKDDVYLQAFLVAPQVNQGSIHRYIAIFPPKVSDKWRISTIVNIYTKQPMKSQMQYALFGEKAVAIGKPFNIADEQQELLTIFQHNNHIEGTAQFGSLQYIMTDTRPQCSLDVFAGKVLAMTIHPNNWYDLYIDSPRVYLTGWAAMSSFKNAHILKQGSITRVYTQGTRTDNRTLLVRELSSIMELLA